MSQIWLIYLCKTMGNSAEILDGLKWKQVLHFKIYFAYNTTPYHRIGSIWSEKGTFGSFCQLDAAKLSQHVFSLHLAKSSLGESFYILHVCQCPVDKGDNILICLRRNKCGSVWR